MLLHGVMDTEFEIFRGMLVGFMYSPKFTQMKPPLILPMDSRLMHRSRARVVVAQTHRFPAFLQAPRQPLGGRGCFAPMGVPLSAAVTNVSAKTNTKSFMG
jgi:hypothetical protein